MATSRDIKNTLKRWLNFFGTLLAVAGIFFVFVRLRNYSGQINISHFSIANWSFAACLALIYGAANILLALSWHYILNSLQVKTRLHWALRVYGLSQLAKYVPGNIFHLAGRQAMGMAHGIPAKKLGISLVLEILLLAASGFIFGILLGNIIWPNFPIYFWLLLLVLIITGAIFFIRTFFSLQLTFAFLCLVLFLACSGSIFTAGLLLLAPETPFTGNFLIIVCGTYIIAWLIGLITPGAPAGIGIREVVLIYFLSGYIPSDTLVFAVALGRMVTVTGDLFFFLASYFFPVRT